MSDEWPNKEHIATCAEVAGWTRRRIGTRYLYRKDIESGGIVPKGLRFRPKYMEWCRRNGVDTPVIAEAAGVRFFL